MKTLNMKSLNRAISGVTAMAALVGALAPVASWAGPRVLMAQTSLKFGSDTDVVNLPSCPSRRNKPVFAVQIQTLKKGADIDYVMVRYENGVWDNLPLRERFWAGERSRVIDLPGGKRCVDAIVVRGDTIGGGRQALVRVFGYR
ncbi:MAG: hypothetical protein AAB425_14190 [Bdellovibrionota bacterium]